MGAGTNELRIAMKVVYLWGIESTGREWESGRQRKKAIKGKLSSQSSPWANGASVQFSCSVVSDSLRPHEFQQARPPCPSPTPRVHPNPCPSSRWCHSTISSSVVPFSSSSHQSFGVSALASVPPMNTQDWSPLGWTGWFSVQSKGLSRVFFNTTVQKHQFFGAQPSL